MKHEAGIGLTTAALLLLLMWPVDETHIMMAVRQSQVAAAKSSGLTFFRDQYGDNWCLKVAGYERPTNWFELTPGERQALVDSFMATNNAWTAWVTDGWKQYREIANTNNLWQIGAYWQAHLQRGGITITTNKAAVFQEFIRTNAPAASFTIMITNDIPNALLDNGFEIVP